MWYVPGEFPTFRLPASWSALLSLINTLTSRFNGDDGGSGWVAVVVGRRLARRSARHYFLIVQILKKKENYVVSLPDAMFKQNNWCGSRARV